MSLFVAGESLWVACQESDELLEFDATAGKVKQRHALRWGARPYGVAASPDGKSLWVSAEGAGELLRVNTADGSVSETVTFGEAGARPAVRGVAVSGDGKRVFVTRFISSADEGQVYEVDAKSGEVTKEHAIVTDSTSKDEQNSGRGVANYISSIVLSPDGVRATVPAKKDNTLRGVTRDGEALTTDNTVRTIVSQLDLEGGGELFEARLDLDDHDMAFAATYSAVGDVVFVVSQGTNKVDVFDAYSGRTVGGASTGLAPQGVALSKDGKLFVQSFMSRRLDVFDVTGLLAGIDSAPKRLAEVSTVTKESLSDEELLGKQIFYNADSPQMSRSGYVACSTCHLDGGQDGRVWDFTDRGEGLRNTISLRGRAGTGHGPVHWTANFDEIQDFENDMRAHFGGSGLMTNEQFDDGDRSDPLGAKKAGVSKSLDALAAYVTSLDTFPRSPYREADGSLSDAAKRGQALFNRLDCRTCHAGEPMTDSGTELHDVGTIKETSGTRRGEKLEGIDTPTLRGLHATAPYLHDGSAATLLDVIDNAKHGNAATLSATQKDDLVQYLLSIENEELGEWAGPAKTGDNLEGSGCGCRAAGRDEPTPIGWLLATLGLWAVRRRRGA